MQQVSVVSQSADQDGEPYRVKSERHSLNPRPLLWRLLFLLLLFVGTLLLFRRPRRGLRALLFLRRTPRFRRRRRSVLGLRRLAPRRSLRPLSRLIPVGLRTIVWLRSRRTVGVRSIRPTVRLNCRRTIGLRPSVRLGCRRTLRFRLTILHSPVRASAAILWTRCRRISRGLSRGPIGWRVIGRPYRFGADDFAVVQSSRLGSSRDGRCAMIPRSPLLRVCASCLRMLRLSGDRRNMPLPRRRLFFRPRTRADPAIAPVVADPRYRPIDHRGVVDVVDDGDVHVVHRSVVEKPVVIPTSALVALAKVSIAVIDSAIESDLRTPVAVIEDKSVAAPTPIGWSPQEADLRRHHPSPRHPVVIVVGVSPVSGRPKITIPRTKRLLIDRQFRRCKVDRYADLCVGCRRQGQQYQCEQGRTNAGEDTHNASSFLMILRAPGVALRLRLARIERRHFRAKRISDSVSPRK